MLFRYKQNKKQSIINRTKTTINTMFKKCIDGLNNNVDPRQSTDIISVVNYIEQTITAPISISKKSFTNDTYQLLNKNHT